MRPHVELVDEKDLLWHAAELPHGGGVARQRNLSYDEENGAASLLVEFLTDLAAGPRRARSADGMVRARGSGDDRRPGARRGRILVCAPRGVTTPAVTADPDTRILLFREYGNWEFTPAEGGAVIDDKRLVVCDSDAMEWYDVIDPQNGSPMDFERGGTPVPGLFIKLLWRDPETGFYTRLIKAKPGWREHPLAHHPVFEEAYCLEGEFDYNFGTMTPGQYFFRPAGVRHGDFTAGEKDGCVWILRCDGDLVDWYTENASMEMKGDPVNWGDQYPGSEPPVYIQPVRSRSIGPWKDPTYQ